MAGPSFDEALAHHQAGRLDEAEAIYCRILASDPSEARAIHMLGMVWFARGNFERALTLVDFALTRGADGAAAHSNRAAILHKLQRYEEAILACDAAIATDPNYAPAFCNRGNSLHASWKGDS